MANPSLQIGNDNWAIKEDNLLGYSTAGTRFVPQPITMTRATLGTRVNPSGLVEDVALLGSEEVVNGDFATDSDWTKGTGWSIANGVASCDGTQTGNSSLSQSSALPSASGKTYKITFTISNYVSGGVEVYPTNTTVGTYTKKTANGTYTRYVTVTSATPNDILYIQADSSFVGSIDNVSVKEATIDNLPRVDYTDGTSSLLVEPQRTNLVTYSEDFSQWSTLGSPQLTSNYGISPDGTENSTRIEFSTNDRIYISVSASGDIAYSVYLKGVGQVKLRDNDGNNTKDITLTSEWIRYEFIFNDTITNIQIQQAVGTSDLQIWGAQAESNSYATSYIKTSGSTVTRNQETYTKTGISDKINSEEGVLFAEISRTEDESNYRLLGLDNGTSQNYIKMGFGDISGNFWIRAVVNSVTVINSDNAVSNNANQFYKIAVRYKSGDSVIYIDGVPVLTSSTTFSSGTFTDLDFTHYTGALNFYGKVKQLQIFKTALSDSELATLTT